MHISAKCSVAVHCLLFIAEYGEGSNSLRSITVADIIAEHHSAVQKTD